MAPAPAGYFIPVEPIPETLEAIDELVVTEDEQADDLAERLRRTADRAQRIVPGLVGVSIASRAHDVTFTLVATDEEVAVLDAVQYLFTGPCVDAMDEGHGISTSPEGLLSEERWHRFARASAAAGVRSTLTFPVVEDGEVVATVNLYGRADDTFAGQHEALAEVFGAWAPGAVTDADLAFTTRATAQEAPDQIRESALIDVATGILAAQRDIAVDEARAQLEDAAHRAGVPVVVLARVLVDLQSGR
jgi:GAF domain-containing protein